jgi:hypothetical protein
VMMDQDACKALLQKHGILLTDEELTSVMKFLGSVLDITGNVVRNDYIATGHLADELNRRLKASGHDVRFRVIDDSDED